MKRGTVALGIHAMLETDQMEALIGLLKSLPDMLWPQKAPFTRATVSARMRQLQNEDIQVVCDLRREDTGSIYGTRVIANFTLPVNLLSDGPAEIASFARGAVQVSKQRYKI